MYLSQAVRIKRKERVEYIREKVYVWRRGRVCVCRGWKKEKAPGFIKKSKRDEKEVFGESVNMCQRKKNPVNENDRKREEDKENEWIVEE